MLNVLQVTNHIIIYMQGMQCDQMEMCMMEEQCLQLPPCVRERDNLCLTEVGVVHKNIVQGVLQPEVKLVYIG